MNSDQFQERVDALIQAMDVQDQARDPHDYVGGSPRPGRILTVGRRRADRWLVRLGFVTFALLIGFMLWTSYQQDIRAKQLDRQEEELRCFALDTQTFEIAVGDVLLAMQNPTRDPAELERAKTRLAAVQGQLRRSSNNVSRSECPPL